MNRLPNTLLCTVGTSLFAPNLKGIRPEMQYQEEPKPGDIAGRMDMETLKGCGLWEDKKTIRSILQGLQSGYQEQNWKRIASFLVQFPPSLRVCGAEINSIEAMIRKRFLPDSRPRLFLLVSDTDDGIAIGKTLTEYFTHPECPIRFDACSFLTVRGLQDEKPLVFQREGLSNLVRILGEELRKWGVGSIAINATGGYKAQIALAVAFGQATRCPVFYKHERFDQIIRFPRIPFTVDLTLVGEHLKLWADLAEPGAVFTSDQIEALLSADEATRESIEPMLEDIEEEGTSYYSLSALGMVYWEAYLTLHPGVTLEPSKVSARTGCRFPQHHYPIGFKRYVEAVYSGFPDHISGCHAVDYSRQKAIRAGTFYEKEGKIFGEYEDKTDFGGRFAILSLASNQLERKWLLNRLKSWQAAGRNSG